ncbi:MAG: transcriptional repressor [Phycisphaerae bacterium]|nr:transcriptional repressor [Phycisphaerae bacterium]MDD5381429.1 transcriptional repressor [Phycisphaerae bacterium]
MRSQTKESVDNLLGSAKLRRTDQRRIILNILLNTKHPQTADEIMAAMSRKSANKVTVYRTLESMVGAGLVHKAFIRKRAEHFELADRCTDTQCHPHFTCTNCGATNCMVGVSIPLVKHIEEGFVIHRQQVHLEGLCPQCA